MIIYEKLAGIQQKVKAPKDKNNDFGKYKYRSAESILEAVKPYLAEFGCVLTLTDDVVEIGGRVFVKAVATIMDSNFDTARGGPETISTTAFAEISEHKGMTADQQTGTASSYARKYALNGLLLLDDTKDADTNEYRRERDAKSGEMISAQQLGKIKTELLRTGKEEKAVCERFGVERMEELTSEQAESALRGLKATK